MKKEITIFFFVSVVLASFIIHVGNRNQHFQECDSTLPLHLVRQFPQHQLTDFVANYMDRKINLTSQKIVEKLFKVPFIKNHTLDQMAGLSENEVIRRLSLKSPIGVLRAVTRTVLFSSLFSISPSYPLESAFITPFTSTYSFGSGLIYGLLFINPNISYENFSSLALIITQLLFHLSVILLFLIITKIGLDYRAGIMAGIAMLFSIGMYSYGYNLGLTIWNIFTGFLWLYVLAVNLKHKDLLRRMSLASGLLIFFNYLILFYWGAFLLAYVYLHLNKELRINNYELGINNWRKIKSSLIHDSLFIIQVLKSQWLAILLIGICAAIFYPPGGGNPVTTSFPTFLYDFYYVILNFFSFYNHNKILDFFQFVLFSVITLGGVVYLFKNNSSTNKDSEPLSIFKKTLLFFILFFIIAAVMKVLGFAPARQILFLAPILFTAAGVFLSEILNYLKSWQINFLLILLAGVGFWTLAIRLNDTKAKFSALSVDSDVKRVVIFDCSFDLFYKDWGLTMPVGWADDPNSLVRGETYLYISQTTPLSKAFKRWQREGYDVKVEALDTVEEESDIYFSPYYPIKPYEVDNPDYYFTKPNGYYKTKFRVVSVEKL